MQRNDRIYVAGHKGMVGSAILRALMKKGYNNIVTKKHLYLDLRSQEDVDNFFADEQPDYVFLCAAKVGGILANRDNKSEFLYDNLMIQNNVIHSANKWGVKKFLFLGSSCIYPKNAEIPIKESALMTGPLEETNDAYAIAKIAGIKLLQSYEDMLGISLMPCNLYGPGDNYDPQNSHVLASLLRKAHDWRMGRTDHIEVWGDGTPLREFMHVDDLAEAAILCMQKYDSKEIINVGYGRDISIDTLIHAILKAIGIDSSMVDIRYDRNKPNGTFRKIMDSSKMRSLGWHPSIPLIDGIRNLYTHNNPFNE